MTRRWAWSRFDRSSAGQAPGSRVKASDRAKRTVQTVASDEAVQASPPVPAAQICHAIADGLTLRGQFQPVPVAVAQPRPGPAHRHGGADRLSVAACARAADERLLDLAGSPRPQSAAQSIAGCRCGTGRERPRAEPNRPAQPPLPDPGLRPGNRKTLGLAPAVTAIAGRAR